jgi:hypothetical protein
MAFKEREKGYKNGHSTTHLPLIGKIPKNRTEKLKFGLSVVHNADD